MQPGDTITIRCGRQTAAGAASTGKVSGDFLTTCRGVSMVQSGFAEGVTVGNWRWYSWTIVLPAGAGNLGLSVDVASGTDWITAPFLDLELADMDSLSASFVLASAPVVTVAQGSPTGELQFTLPKGDYASISWTVTDAAGSPVDLSGYNNLTLGIKSQDQTTTIYTQTTGITASAGGLVTVVIPESATFYAALPTGVDSITLYFSLTGDQAATATQTRTLGQGTVTVRRREV